MNEPDKKSPYFAKATSPLIQVPEGQEQRRIPYILQKRDEGWKIFGVLPGHYPKEVLLAAGILPVEIWDPPVDRDSSYAHLQPTICGIVKTAFSFLSSSNIELLDGLLFCHTCDSLQNLGSLIKDIGINKDIPCLFFYNPKEPFNPSVNEYYKKIVQRLIEDLKTFSFKVEEDKIAYWLKETQRQYDKIRQFYEFRVESNSFIRNSEFYTLMNGFGFLLPQDLIDSIKAFISMDRPNKQGNKRILLSGILPYPRDLFMHLDSLGVRVVEDDFLFLDRRIPMYYGNSQDNLGELLERFLSLPPCPTRGTDTDKRIGYLVKKARGARANGVVFLAVQFCEPEYFDFPQVQAALRDHQIPSLVLETEVGEPLNMACTTRLEAFLEGLQ